MKKWTKRLSLSGLALAGMMLTLALIGWRLVRGTPDWYQPQLLTAEQREAAAQRVTEKLVTVQNQAARARAAEQAGTREPATQPAGSISISFTDEELNALLETWSVWKDVKNAYDRFISTPYIVFQDGRLILAGRVKELGAVASLHFEPRLDGDSKLAVKLVRTLAGKLPLPQAIGAQYRQRASQNIRQRLPAWRRQASIDATGIANSAAISAMMGQFLVNVLENRASDPVLFVPLVGHPVDRSCVPAQLTELSIKDHTMTLVVRPMSPEERAELLRNIRDGSPVATGEK